MTHAATPSPTEPRRTTAWKGAKQALLAWPLITVVVMGIALIALSAAKRLEDTNMVFFILFFGPLRYGLPGWPIVAALVAGVCALCPHHLVKRVAWIVSAGCVLAAPFVFFGLTALWH